MTSRASAISTEMHAVGEMEVDGKPEGERDDEGDTLGLGVVPRQWKNPAPLFTKVIVM